MKNEKRRMWAPRDAKTPDGTEIKVFTDGASFFAGPGGSWRRVGQIRDKNGKRIRLSAKDRRRLGIKKKHLKPQRLFEPQPQGEQQEEEKGDGG